MSTERTLVIEAGRSEQRYWSDLWQYRELFQFLAWRDILVRYKQTAIGVVWAVLRPLLTMVVFTVVFQKLAKLPAVGAPYPVMVFAAMLPWQLFSSALVEASNSLVGNSNLLSKVYFPRLIVPASAILTCIVDFAISFVLLLGLMGIYGLFPGWKVVVLPLLVLLAIAASAGFGLWLAALNVRYRDVRYVVPFLVQLGLYVSPVGFSTTVVPERWRLLYALNPMVGVIDGFRWSLLEGAPRPYAPGMLLSVLITLGVLASGTWYFRRTERTLADVI